MPINRRILSQDAAVVAAADSAEGLVLHLDANDEDSIENGGANTGAGSGTWFDISTHDLNVPLVDKASNLQLHLNASDTTSYGGSGSTWTDISGNTRNGAITGATFDSDVRGYFEFDGSANDNVKISDTALVQSGGTNFSVEAWVRRAGTGTYDYIASQTTDNGLTQNWLLRFNNNNTIGWFIYGSNNYMSTSTTYSANVWYHVVALVESDGTSRIYVDGTLVTSSSSGQSASTTSYNTFVGSLGDGTNATMGDLDISQFRIYDVALTDSEIAQNYRAGNFLSYDSIYDTNLQANFDAANYTSGAWTDSVNSNLGTLNNMTVGANFDKEVGNFFDFLNAGSNASDNQNITVPDSSSLSPTSTLSIEVIVNPDSFSNHQRIVWKDGSYGLYASASGVYTFFINSPSTAVTTTLNETGKFKHIVGTYDGANMKIYINGILKNTVPNTSAITDNANNFTIGGDGSSQRYYNGQIGFVRLFSSALSDAQVAQNYLATKNDYPNGNNATNNGATFSATTPAYFDFVTNDYFETSISKNWASIPFSVEMWFNTDSRNGEYLWGLNDTAGNGIAASLRGSGNSYHLQFLGSGVVVSAGAVDENEWYQVVFTSDGTTKKAYLNGAFVASGTTTINSAANAKAFIFGRYGTANAGYYDGKIGLVRLFDKELTSSEVTANYDADKATYGLS